MSLSSYFFFPLPSRGGGRGVRLEEYNNTELYFLRYSQTQENPTHGEEEEARSLIVAERYECFFFSPFPQSLKNRAPPFLLVKLSILSIVEGGSEGGALQALKNKKK